MHDQHAEELEELGVRTHVAIQDPISKKFTIYGVIIEARDGRLCARESDR